MFLFTAQTEELGTRLRTRVEQKNKKEKKKTCGENTTGDEIWEPGEGGGMLENPERSGRTNSEDHVKNSIPFLDKRKVQKKKKESSRGFTEIKQVSTRSIQVCRVQQGSMFGTLFVLRVEPLDMGELTFHAEKTACCRLQQETKVHI